MTVGNNVSADTINSQLTGLSTQLRNTMQQIRNLNQWTNGQNTGLATLEGVGFDPSDAATALSMISYLNTMAAVYYGTAAQPTAFDFDQELSQVWAGG